MDRNFPFVAVTFVSLAYYRNPYSTVMGILLAIYFMEVIEITCGDLSKDLLDLRLELFRSVE